MDAGVAEADGVDSALGMVAIEHFDCILIDYHLGGIDGVSLANQIRASHGPATPMVMLTAEPSPALAEQALGSGLSDFLSKRNLTSEQLRQTLCNAMVKRKVLREKQLDISELGHGDRDAVLEISQTVTQALSLLDQSQALQKCLLEDEDTQMAIDLLRNAALIPQDVSLTN